MRRIASILAGVIYALTVFTLGFGLGTVRVLIVAPRLGADLAVLVEMPIILGLSWLVSRWCCKRLEIRPDPLDRALMGTIAFAVLMILESGVSIWIFDRPFADQLTQYKTASGLIGLAAQVIFATFPYFQAKSRLRL